MTPEDLSRSKERGASVLDGEGSVVASDGVSLVWRSRLPRGHVQAAVLFLHGGLEHGGRYLHVAERLADAGLATYLPDLRGHGRSGGRPADIERMSQLVDDLDRMLALVASGWSGLPIFLLGHSLGATVALEYATRGGGGLTGMVVTGAGIDVSAVSPLQRNVVRALARLAPRVGLVAFDSRGISRDSTVVEAYDADPLVFRGKAPLRTVAELLASGERVTAAMPSLEVPILILHGGRDRVSSPAGSRLAHERVGSKDKTIMVYRDLYHDILNEPEKEAVIADVIAWIRQRI
jgi:alpha-beta hydrolase superfamily lysophospholipase